MFCSTKAFVNERMLQANFCSLGALFSVDSADQTVRTCHLPSTIGPFSKLPGEFQNARCHLVSQANEFAKQQCKYIQQQLYTFVVRLHQPAVCSIIYYMHYRSCHEPVSF
eukprot:m.180210 g.180210  ORF g.180210 m.180210 type:complete len:110 (-) comp16853_c0_seq3:645-974(-)